MPVVVALSTLAVATIIDSCRCGRNRRPMTANDGRVWSGFTLKNTIYLYNCTICRLDLYYKRKTRLSAPSSKKTPTKLYNTHSRILFLLDAWSLFPVFCLLLDTGGVSGQRWFSIIYSWYITYMYRTHMEKMSKSKNSSSGIVPLVSATQLHIWASYNREEWTWIISWKYKSYNNTVVHKNVDVYAH